MFASCKLERSLDYLRVTCRPNKKWEDKWKTTKINLDKSQIINFFTKTGQTTEYFTIYYAKTPWNINIKYLVIKICI